MSMMWYDYPPTPPVPPMGNAWLGGIVVGNLYDPNTVYEFA
jgi:hypothetical protein